MKKSALLLIAVLLSVGTFAQHRSGAHARGTMPAARTTAIGDTTVLSNITTADTLTTYTYAGDTGFIVGTNYYGDMGFAERYDFNSADSSIRVIGVMARFGGKVSASSTHSVNFHVWDVTPPVLVTATTSYSGFPNTQIDTLNVPFTQLGIGLTSDTLKSFFFDSATRALNQPFYVGYDMVYDFTSLAGDTIGLYSSLDGERLSPAYFAYMYVNDFGDTTRDTVLNVQNATQWSDGTWNDNYYDNDGLFNNLSIFPIVAVNAPTGINGVSHKNLTFYGNYPNPASDNTNIRFALLTGADVTIQVMDMSGHALSTTQYKSLAAGEHIINIPVSNLAQGDYLYSIRTSTGEGMAAKMSIIR